MDNSIYEPPKADLTQKTGSFEDEYGIVQVASTGKRFLNLLIDFVGYTVLSVAVGLFLGVTGLFEAAQGVPDFVFGVVVMTLYYVPQEAAFGRTLGKLVTGTQAVSDNGSPLTMGQAMGRTLCRFIPFDALSYLFGAGYPEGWHDRIPGTKVISIRR